MAQTVEWVKRPPPDTDYRARSTYRVAGIVIALGGMMVVAVATIGNFVAASDLSGDPGGAARTLAWTFGLNTTGFAIIKVAIAVTLIGIILRLWLRVDSVKAALSTLVPKGRAELPLGETKTPYGRATVTPTTPKPLLIHSMAKALWLPMLVMGVMAVAVGFILSLATAGQTAGSETFLTLSAWTQGLIFLGEALVLSGISFLLGTILASLRAGGGEVQESLGVHVKTLRMPGSAKVFVALMLVGMMLGVLQFVLYLVAIGSVGDAVSFSAWLTWLGPLREAALGVLLAGIVLALYTISKVLGFQFTRIRELITAAV